MWNLIMVIVLTNTAPGGNGGYMRPDQRPAVDHEVVTITTEFNTQRECVATSQDIQQQLAHSGGQAIVAACRPRGQSY